MLRLSASAFRSRFKRLGDIKKRYAEKTSTAVSIRSLLAFLERLFKIGSPFGCYILDIITPYTWAIKLIRFVPHAARPPEWPKSACSVNSNRLYAGLYGGLCRAVWWIMSDCMADYTGLYVGTARFRGYSSGLRGPIPDLFVRGCVGGRFRGPLGPLSGPLSGFTAGTSVR